VARRRLILVNVQMGWSGMFDTMMTRHPILALPLAVLFLTLMPISQRVTAQTQSVSEVWKVPLRQQLLDERNCELKSFLFIRSFRLAGDKVLEGRVACYDGREFDFTRPRPHAKFKLRLCLPTAC
jgi:hypothetical protein